MAGLGPSGWLLHHPGPLPAAHLPPCLTAPRTARARPCSRVCPHPLRTQMSKDPVLWGSRGVEVFWLKGERAGEKFCNSRRNGGLEQLTEVKMNFLSFFFF